ncbi:MAG: class C sortase [Inconstantimicrobium porci]|uniref:class C sortase n=1 Tax=Inconstantimicrobium porci TaxID=2652291 RepID=UPI002A91B78E|nr:class C sortase [Inconstantimicrobium porci]MDY5910838.1 class C sortase [Inconstantimicrobium porci]
MRKIVIKILTFILFAVGLCSLLYPIISNEIMCIIQQKDIDTYNNSVKKYKKSDIDRIFKEAEDYNVSRSFCKDIMHDTTSSNSNVNHKNYNDILNFENGIMGYISIPEIDVNLPIYHGISDSVLRKGVGHISTTAFPISGMGCHSVLSGHTGLPSARLFTDLDRLKINDYFYIKILNKTFKYKVDKISVVSPTDTRELIPVKNKNYVTLVTCTPYSINTNRLLVRGVFVENDDKQPVAKREDKTFLYCCICSVGIAFEVIFLVKIKRYRMKMKR